MNERLRKAFLYILPVFITVTLFFVISFVVNSKMRIECPGQPLELKEGGNMNWEKSFNLF